MNQNKKSGMKNLQYCVTFIETNTSHILKEELERKVEKGRTHAPAPGSEISWNTGARAKDF